MKHLVLRACTLACAWPWLAVAQPLGTGPGPGPIPPADPSQVVITATRSPVFTQANVRPVTVISSEALQLSGAVSLADVLRAQGGVEMSSNGGLGQVSGVMLRGANTDQTVVLIDGVRIGSATSGTAALEAIPLALIDHIEILPGPASSLYGSDAIGGVIQIFTRDGAAGRAASMALTVGSQGLRQVSASYAGALTSDTSVSLAANQLQARGINATTPDNLYSYNADRDGLRQRAARVRLTQRLNDEEQISLSWLQSRNRVHFDDGPDPTFPADTRIDSFSDTLNQTLALDWTHQVSGGLDAELRLARSQDESDDQSSYAGFFNTRQDQASWLNRIPLGGGTATMGLEWLRQRVDSSVGYTVGERSVRSGMLGWRGHWGPHALQVDLRQDRNSQFGDHNTGQLAWAYRVSPDFRWRAAWGSAFHAPSFNWLYYPGFGNPELQPERSRSLEIGADGELAGLTASATLFDNRIRDLIDAAPPDYQPLNIGRARITGLTLAGSGKLGAQTDVKLSLTVQNPRDDITGNRLRRRAAAFGNLHLAHAAGAWRVGGDLSRVGRRFDSSDESAASRMGAYSLLALFAKWKVSAQWALEARLNNAADKRYQTAQGYAVPGREGQLTLRWAPVP